MKVGVGAIAITRAASGVTCACGVWSTRGPI